MPTTPIKDIIEWGDSNYGMTFFEEGGLLCGIYDHNHKNSVYNLYPDTFVKSDDKIREKYYWDINGRPVKTIYIGSDNPNNSSYREVIDRFQYDEEGRLYEKNRIIFNNDGTVSSKEQNKAVKGQWERQK